MQTSIQQAAKELDEVRKRADDLKAENKLLNGTLQSTQTSNRTLQKNLADQRSRQMNENNCSQVAFHVAHYFYLSRAELHKARLILMSIFVVCWC